MSAETTTNDPIEQLRDARRRLQEERDKLAARLAEIDAALAEAGGRAAGTRRPAAVLRGTAEHPLDTTSVPRLVRSILVQHPEGMKATELIEAVQEVLPKTEARHVHAVLRQAKSSGPRRGKTYKPKPEWS